MNRKIFSHLGVNAYGVGTIALGISGLVWRDFATDWQRVHGDFAGRTALAVIVALCELVSGVLLLRRQTARAAAAMLTILYFILVLLWVPPILAAPTVYDSYGNFFEELSLVLAGAVAYASFAPAGSGWANRRALISRCYGVCAISFALEHFFYLQGAASFVPKWIPPGQMFWAVATAVFFSMAAAAILTGILAGLASRLLAIMIFSFEVLVWAPRLFHSPRVHFEWSGNAVALALSGAAWLLADAIGERQGARVPQTAAKVATLEAAS